MTKPSQYTKGWVEFYKLKFKVTPDVLIPRPETELLVDSVLRVASSEKRVMIIDVGTGAGNISISIAKNSSHTKIIATDVSNKALKVAKQNAKFHQVDHQITFLKSDLFKNPQIKPLILNTSPSLLILVTNLPYIPSSRIPYLDPSVKDWEPHVALDGGEDGFELYRSLFVQMIKKNLFPSYFFAEIDYTQGELAVLEALKYFPQCSAEVKLDLAHRQRILLIKF